jgi:hypothetical protein
MLTKFIKKIRAKPDHVRKGITLAVSLVITGVMTFFWFISFLNYSAQVFAAKPKVETPTNFLNKIGSLIGESYANARAKIGGSDISGDVPADTSTDTQMDMPADESTNTFTNTPTSTSTETTTDLSNDPSNEVSAVNSAKIESTYATPKSDSTTLNDILNTKKQDNQDKKATTSSEVLVQ